MSGVAILLACAGPAAAQDGAGLYEPFPEPSSLSVSRHYIETLRAPGARLGSELTERELTQGIRVPAAELPRGEALPAAVAAGPAARAESESFAGTGAAWVGVAALVAFCAVAARRLATL